MFLIEKLWFDPLENRDAMGFTSIGWVSTKEEADRICGLERIQRSTYPWPLKYASFQGCDSESVPRFTATAVRELTGMSHEQLKAL
jgi:hypothetical protein